MSETDRLSLRHPDGTTTIYIGNHVLEATRGAVTRWVEGRRMFVISTPRVLSLHGEALDSLLSAAQAREVLVVPEGEEAKCLEVAGSLWTEILTRGGKRDSRLIAFGGGSVGDLGGFVAGCFLRGIEYLQMPTTLLAQVDAALGGKTAIDCGGAKNSVGLFHHPAMVISEASFLSTLPKEEIRAALAEVIKMAALLDPLLLERLEGRLPELLKGDPESLAPVVLAAARAKVRVVQRDPGEAGERRLLNFGHTLGHALEAAAVDGSLRHGDAVAYGMLFALRLALNRGLEEAVAGRLEELIQGLGLPPLPTYDIDVLMALMQKDKKNQETGLVWVLPESVGQGKMFDDVEPDEVRDLLPAFLEHPWTA
ncbi:MAG: 3-dehydroquinate synthase [Deltaproteobacteria bacterium]|nr:3-dehydroquinate synthase [Deltaproteobacteria bacterium]